jgi:hypothetical protein
LIVTRHKKSQQILFAKEQLDQQKEKIIKQYQARKAFNTNA